MRVRADEGDLLGEQPIGELGFFGEEAEAGVDRLRASLLGGVDDLVDHEIALRGGRGADEDAFVSHIHRETVAIGFREHDGRLDAQPSGGADNADGDLAAIGDQDFIEHERGVSGVSRPRHRGKLGA